MIDVRICDWQVLDVRFPTSESLDGSDAMHADPDYSAAYVILRTDHPEGIEGHGLTFTVGRDDTRRAEKAVNEAIAEIGGGQVSVYEGIAKLS